MPKQDSSFFHSIAELRSAGVEVAKALEWHRNWLAGEHGIERPRLELAEPFALNVDAFVAAVRKARGRRRPLTPAGVAAVREAWRETIAPVRAQQVEALRLERELSDMVNAAYGLTPEEVALMWRTAPPRMPIPPPAELAIEAA